jgi:organic hydroperoxide reductase OsmC/OhrA
MTSTKQQDSTYTTITKIAVGESGPAAWVERTASMPDVDQPLVFGVRPAMAAKYGVKPDQFPVRSTTTDIMIAAVGACMTGTFLAFLEGRGIEILRENIDAEVIATVGPDSASGSSTPIVQSIHIRYVVDVDPSRHATIERVHQNYDRGCWLSQTLAGSRCSVTSELTFGNLER